MGERKPPTRAEVRRIILDCVREGRVIRSGHFLERLGSRGLTIQDAYDALRSCVLEGLPVWDDRHHNYSARVKGRIDGVRYVFLVVAMPEQMDRIVLVTIFEES